MKYFLLLLLLATATIYNPADDDAIRQNNNLAHNLGDALIKKDDTWRYK